MTKACLDVVFRTLFPIHEKEKRMPEKRHLVCADKLQKIKGNFFENQGRSMDHELTSYF